MLRQAPRESPNRAPNSSVQRTGRFSRILSSRHGGTLLFVAVYLGISFATRVVLFAKSFAEVRIDSSLAAAFGVGFLYDLGAAAFASLPLTFILTALPARIFTYRWARSLAHLAGIAILYALLFGAAAEWLFWDEFSTRFNFIAVDYLVYTKEVIGNIRESYPMPLIFAVLFIAALGSYVGLMRTGYVARWLTAEPEPAKRRWLAGALWFGGALAVGIVLDADQLPEFKNNYHREIAKNGLWSLFAAFRDNELNYPEFYPTMGDDEAFNRLHRELAADGARPLITDQHDLLRQISSSGPELRLNVIQITVESLSADFVSYFNRASKLTPNLTALAAKSLAFDNLYATGTRTDRGMEALTLSVPPTPGRSLVKRPRNEHLFTLGSVFRSKGYDTAFIYGGFGYFDNMNHFFGENGYRVIDRARVASADITFSNVWGACDEDLFRWTLREADAAHAAGKPFFHFVMTTSNHRPFTYPDGRIDLPSKISGRSGAVKYTDYAIGEFLRAAEAKPWFRNTIIVVVADHCASVAGKTALPIQNYHIPLFVYAPGGQIAPGHIGTLMSQIDYAPTLLGLLNWSYPSRFFGHDIRRIDPARGRALIGNYQSLGFYRPGQLAVLSPVRKSATFSVDTATQTVTETHAPDAELLADSIAYYQAASYLFRNRLQRELPPAGKSP